MRVRFFISHTTNVLLFKCRCNIFIGVRIIKEMPGSVASGTPCIIILVTTFKQVFTIIYLKQTVFLGYTGWSKGLCAPLIVLQSSGAQRLSEASGTPCIIILVTIFMQGIYNYIPETNGISRIYRVIKRSLFTFGLFCNHQVHRDFRKLVGHPVLLSLLPPSCRYLQLYTWNKPCF